LGGESGGCGEVEVEGEEWSEERGMGEGDVDLLVLFLLCVFNARRAVRAC
jgi:hypothetical protein